MTPGPSSPWPRGKFSVLYLDPPWHYATYNEKGRSRCPDWKRFKGSPAKHYETMSLADLKAPPVGDLAADDCAMLMWAVDPMLPQALELIEAYGFTYKTVGFYWVKTNRVAEGYAVGCGYWTRANPEQCLLATRGRPKRLNKDVRRLIVSPRREHSRKPDEAYERIERLLPGPYCELFSRSERPGWTSWGNQTGKFALQDSLQPVPFLSGPTPSYMN